MISILLLCVLFQNFFITSTELTTTIITLENHLTTLNNSLAQNTLTTELELLFNKQPINTIKLMAEKKDTSAFNTFLAENIKNISTNNNNYTLGIVCQEVLTFLFNRFYLDYQIDDPELQAKMLAPYFQGRFQANLVLFITHVIHDILAKRPKKTDPITIVSLSTGDGVIECTLAALLLKKGFPYVILCGIDINYGEDKIENYQNNFTQLCSQLQIPVFFKLTTPAPNLPHITCMLYENVQELLYIHPKIRADILVQLMPNPATMICLPFQFDDCKRIFTESSENTLSRYGDGIGKATTTQIFLPYNIHELFIVSKKPKNSEELQAFIATSKDIILNKKYLGLYKNKSIFNYYLDNVNLFKPKFRTIFFDNLFKKIVFNNVARGADMELFLFDLVKHAAHPDAVVYEYYAHKPVDLQWVHNYTHQYEMWRHLKTLKPYAEWHNKPFEWAPTGDYHLYAYDDAINDFKEVM